MIRESIIDPEDMDPVSLLNHAEKILEDFVPLIEKVPTEDKLLLAYEQDRIGLEPWEIQEIVQAAMNNLPGDLEESHIAQIFDIIYDAVSEALYRAQE